MAPPNADAARRIALRAQEHKLLFYRVEPRRAGHAPSRRSAPALDAPANKGGIRRGRTGHPRGPKGDEEKVSFSAREVLTKLTALRGDIVSQDILSIAMLLGATRLGDMILQAGLSRRDEPLLQFARHFRDAAAHGDRWSFRQGQPETPAACRDLVLAANMVGGRPGRPSLRRGMSSFWTISATTSFQG